MASERYPTTSTVRSSTPTACPPSGSPLIRDDAIALAEKATAAGVDVTLEIWPNMVHLWHNFSYLPDAQRAPERIGQFVDECASAPHT